MKRVFSLIIETDAYSNKLAQGEAIKNALDASNLFPPQIRFELREIRTAGWSVWKKAPEQ